MTCETLIIGAGVIGLSIARELHRRGERGIVVVDRGRAGGEASWAAAGMLTPQADADQADTFFRFCSDARDMYPEFANDLLEETGIDIELERTGTISAAFAETEYQGLKDRYEWQRAAGLEGEIVSGTELQKIEPALSDRFIGGLIFPNDWQVENRRLMAALIEYARLNHIEIIENIEVQKLTVEGGCVTGIESSTGTIQCRLAILAAGAWTSLIDAVPLDIAPVRGQMICFRPEAQVIRHVILSSNGYLVPRRDGRMLAGATVENAGFDNCVTVEGIETLRKMALEIVPSLGKLNVTDSWSGLRPFAADGLPALGKVPGIEGLIVATGHFRNGILLAPLTAILIVERMLGQYESEYLKAFGAARFAQAANTC